MSKQKKSETFIKWYLVVRIVLVATIITLYAVYNRPKDELIELVESEEVYPNEVCMDSLK